MYWRRNSFNKAPYIGKKPKWHISPGEVVQHGRNTGICGYEYNSTLGGIIIRDVVNNPALLCSKCLDLTRV